jgi:hypothetical protein
MKMPSPLVSICLSAIVSGPLLVVGALMYAYATDPLVSTPISLAEDDVKIVTFRPWTSGYYTFGITVKRGLPDKSLDCLLGLSDRKAVQTIWKSESVLDAEWTLSSCNEVIGHGESIGNGGGAWGNESIERIIGRFHGEMWRRYSLTVRSRSNTSLLASAEPHLTVEPAIYSGYRQFKDLLIGVACVEAIAGIVLLILFLRREC